MEIRNLITFVQVAELNSFTGAAKALDYSQSTVSFQIKQLENELGCLLFERINHTLNLTGKGRELLDYAQRVCRMTDEFMQSLTDEREVAGYVHIVAPDSVCEVMMTDNYGDFFSRYPGIRLKFSTADTDNMFRLLDRNEADVMLTLDSHVYHKDYIIAKEVRMPMHFVTGSNSPMAKMGRISLPELTGMPFILTEKGMGYRRVLDEALARESIEIQPVLEISRTDIITKMLEAGKAVSFLPDFVTRKRVEEGALAYLEVDMAEIEIWQQLIYHRNKWISNALGVFLRYVMENEFSR